MTTTKPTGQPQAPDTTTPPGAGTAAPSADPGVGAADPGVGAAVPGVGTAVPGDAGTAASDGTATAAPGGTGTSAPAAGAAAGERPMRADALRNHAKVVAAAREVFAQDGAQTSLEAVARRAGVGIGTLYRHFPTRQALLEAVYRGEVEQLCDDAQQFLTLDPWDGFAALAERLVNYLATKQALAPELLAYVGQDSTIFQTCRGSLLRAGQPLLERAQAAHVLRADTDLAEVIQLVGGIARIQTTGPGQREHLLQITLDGLRERP